MVATGWKEWNFSCTRGNVDQMVLQCWSTWHGVIQSVTSYLSLSFQLDPGAELSQEHQIKYDWCSEERVLAGVVQHDGVLAAHEDLRGVLIHGSLAVPDVGHILQQGVSSFRTNLSYLILFDSCGVCTLALCTRWKVR